MKMYEKGADTKADVLIAGKTLAGVFNKAYKRYKEDLKKTPKRKTFSIIGASCLFIFILETMIIYFSNPDTVVQGIIMLCAEVGLLGFLIYRICVLFTQSPPVPVSFRFDMEKEIIYDRLIVGFKYLRSNNNLYGVTTLDNGLPYIKTNCQLVVFVFRDKMAVFLSDFILVFKNEKWEAVEYENLKMEYNDICVNDGATDDTEVLYYGWQHANKDGSPDMRYSVNERVPICAYGQINIAIKNDVAFAVAGSNRNKTKFFYSALETLAISVS